jgi:hypothetical protein
MITNKLASYGSAKKHIMPAVERRQHKELNNRAENSQQPTRPRERQMKRFKSPGQAQHFLSGHDQINILAIFVAKSSPPPTTEVPEHEPSTSGQRSLASASQHSPPGLHPGSAASSTTSVPS